MERSRLVSVAAMQVLICVWIAFTPATWNEWRGGFAVSRIYLGITLGLCVIAAAWAVLGRSSLIVRYVTSGALLAMTGLSAFLYFRRQNPSDSLLDFVLLLGCITLAWSQAMVVLAILSQWFKLTLSRAGEPPQRSTTSQFHLSHLLIAITIAAIFLAVGRYSLSGLTNANNPFLLDELGWLAVILSLLVTFGVIAALAGALSILYPRAYLPWAIVACVAVVLLGVVQQWLMQMIEGATGSIPVYIANLASFAWVTLNAIVLRTGGWRLSRRLDTPDLKRA